MRTLVLGWLNSDRTSWNYGKPRSACWMLFGTSKDLRKAREFAHTQRYCVFVFRTDDKRDVLALVRDAMASGQFTAA